jgi:hypothetical protein
MVRLHLVAATVILRCYNPTVLNRFLLFTVFESPAVFGQQESKQPSSSQPQVKLNYLNVCTPSAHEQALIAGAFALELGSLRRADVSWLAGAGCLRAQDPEVTR